MRQRRSSRNVPLKALQVLAEMGVALDDSAALKRVVEGLQSGTPKCCIAFGVFYGRAIDAGRPDLFGGYRTWMNRSAAAPLDYVPCPRCLIEGGRAQGAPAVSAVAER